MRKGNFDEESNSKEAQFDNVFILIRKPVVDASMMQSEQDVRCGVSNESGVNHLHIRSLVRIRGRAKSILSLEQGTSSPLIGARLVRGDLGRKLNPLSH